ncbi:MAG: type II toxin-antitoxin system VapC family toxin, partial [Actinomycetota bacterium]
GSGGSLAPESSSHHPYVADRRLRAIWLRSILTAQKGQKTRFSAALLALVEKNANGPRAVETYRFFCEVWETLHEFQVIPYTEEAERIFQQIPPEVKRKGPRDCRIAATAMAHGAIVVTHNTRDFARIPGVRYEDWASSLDLSDERSSEEFYETK